MSLSERHRAGGALVGVLAIALVVTAFIPNAIAADPLASSSLVGTEDPLFENGAWEALTSVSPDGTRFMKSNGAFPDRIVGPGQNHAGARTTAIMPSDHYSEIVVGHIGSSRNNVGPIVRVQPSGAAVDSHYLWWGSQVNGINALYRVDANGTSYTATPLLQTSPVVDGDRMRLIARGLVIYGMKNGVREFIYNTGPDNAQYLTGTTGMLAFGAGPELTDAMIASWSSGGAPASSGTHDSSNFIGVEDPLDEGDRWYPLPGYSGFRKAGGVAMGRDLGHNATGAWSIAPSPNQYSEVTLGTIAGGGGGPMVRIDRNSLTQTGWLLFLWAEHPDACGIFKLNPDGNFERVTTFSTLIVSGDKWRLAANGNALEVFRNGVFQFTYVTDGSFAAGDVGMEALSTGFTFMGWEGGELPTAPADTQAPSAPGTATAIPTSGTQINVMWMAASDDVGVTGYLIERCQGSGCTAFSQIATVTGTAFNDTALSPNTSYTYRVRATDAAGNLGAYSNQAGATTLLF